MRYEGSHDKVVRGEWSPRACPNAMTLPYSEYSPHDTPSLHYPPLLWSSPVGTDTTCRQIKMGVVAYMGGDYFKFNKTDTTCQQVNLGIVAYLGAV